MRARSIIRFLKFLQHWSILMAVNTLKERAGRMFLKTPRANAPENKSQGFDAQAAPDHCTPPILFIVPAAIISTLLKLGLYTVVDDGPSVERAVRRFDAALIALISTDASRLESSLKPYGIVVRVPMPSDPSRRSLIDAVQDRRRHARPKFTSASSAERFTKHPSPIIPKLPEALSQQRPTGSNGSTIVRDAQGCDVGTIEQIAGLTGRSIAAALEAIVTTGEIDGMFFTISERCSSSRPAQAIRRLTEHPSPIIPKLPEAPSEEKPAGLNGLLVRDEHGRTVGTLEDIASLTGRSVTTAHHEIVTAGKIDGMSFKISEPCSRGLPAQPIRRHRLIDGTINVFVSVAAAAAASSIDATTVMRFARSKNRRAIKGFAFEFANAGEAEK